MLGDSSSHCAPCSALNQLELNGAGTAQATPVEALRVRPPQTRLSPAKGRAGFPEGVF
jgi:hypothetical protein